MVNLTPQQKSICDYIRACTSMRGYPPTVREIAAFLGVSSTSTVQFHLDKLERLGVLTRSAGRTRSVSLTEAFAQPEGIPVVGSVAAGAPILAEENIVDRLLFDPGDDAEYFALVIRGDSMKNAGILNGDTVVVKKTAAARSGEIVIALLDDEATCKRLDTSTGHVRLMPENEDYQPIDGDNAVILGKVSAVVRRY